MGKNVYYKKVGKKGDWIVFLHGWGGSVDSFLAVAKTFENNRCLLIDFPPFGKSESMNEIWKLEDYVFLLKEFLDFLKIDNVKLISHSFGGRVAILFASIYNNVSKLILVDSAGIKPKKNLIIWLKIKKYKLLKKLGFKQKNKGSKDYKSLSDNMKKTFVNIVNRHLEKECLKINCPTLIIFGEKDKTTPIYMAKKLNSLIKDSEVIIFKNAGHFAYLDKFNDFVIISNKFME
ncbi:MAG: alpha/beta hydrolase [Clostridia bacterium]|nr:alpha/beta hydrolase [Clostridia bacterium]